MTPYLWCQTLIIDYWFHIILLIVYFPVIVWPFGLLKWTLNNLHLQLLYLNLHSNIHINVHTSIILSNILSIYAATILPLPTILITAMRSIHIVW